MRKLLDSIYLVHAAEAPGGFSWNSYLFEGERWSLLVDPPAVTDDLLEEAEPWQVEYILCTSRMTFPDSLGWRRALPEAKIVMHIWDAEELGNKSGEQVDRPYLHDFYMKENVRIVHAPGATPGSSVAVTLGGTRALFAGDLLHVDNGQLRRSDWFDEEMGSMSMDKLRSQDWGIECVLPRRSRGEPLAGNAASLNTS
jgi:glyoxylase-like metal-dependent hydrolase (beta-lactamase superfamily II)